MSKVPNISKEEQERRLAEKLRAIGYIEEEIENFIAANQNVIKRSQVVSKELCLPLRGLLKD